MKRTSLVSILFVFLVPVASATIILNPEDMPADQGWDVYSKGLSSVTTDGTAIRINTYFPDGETGSSPMILFYRSIDILSAKGFSVELSLQVHESNFNNYDGGVALLASYELLYGLPTERNQMIIFGEDQIRWGDASDVYQVNTTDDFHTYRLDVDLESSTARFYVDDIIALTRSNFISNGIVAFGDQSNDGQYNMEGSGAVNGDFSIAYIDLVIPEPCTFALFGLAGFALMRRRIQ